MRSLKYLNTILTFIAVLLTLNLWTLWTHSEVSLAAPAQAQGLIDPGAQRLEMIGLLKQVSVKLGELNGLFKNGQARVRLENPPDKDDPAKR